MPKERPTAGQTAVGLAAIYAYLHWRFLVAIPSVETEHLLRFRL